MAKSAFHCCFLRLLFAFQVPFELLFLFPFPFPAVLVRWHPHVVLVGISGIRCMQSVAMLQLIFDTYLAKRPSSRRPSLVCSPNRLFW
jgi:hypothetical protein